MKSQFKPKPVVIVDRFHFCRRNQAPGENVQDCLAELTKQMPDEGRAFGETRRCVTATQNLWRSSAQVEVHLFQFECGEPRAQDRRGRVSSTRQQALSYHRSARTQERSWTVFLCRVAVLREAHFQPIHTRTSIECSPTEKHTLVLDIEVQEILDSFEGLWHRSASQFLAFKKPTTDLYSHKLVFIKTLLYL